MAITTRPHTPLPAAATLLFRLFRLMVAGNACLRRASSIHTVRRVLRQRVEGLHRGGGEQQVCVYDRTAGAEGGGSGSIGRCGSAESELRHGGEQQLSYPRPDDPYLLLHSAAYGRYLGVTFKPLPLGHHGCRTEQHDYDDEWDLMAVMWWAAGAGFRGVVLLRSVAVASSTPTTGATGQVDTEILISGGQHQVT
ncbi:hypothetical protein ZWY2020_046783 [Hordeum vulgare]|nr:hypothetical protein ZWY2020_046783 [Hordeum vulgare]